MSTSLKMEVMQVLLGGAPQFLGLRTVCFPGLRSTISSCKLIELHKDVRVTLKGKFIFDLHFSQI